MKPELYNWQGGDIYALQTCTTTSQIFNLYEPPQDWLSLNFSQLTSRRQANFSVTTNCNYKVGNNMLSNRLSILNNKIDLTWLNDTLSSFKVKCKKLLL